MPAMRRCPQPDEHHRVRAVEQFRSDATSTALGVGLDTPQRADHRHFLAAATVNRPLRAGVGGLVTEFLDVLLLGGVLCESPRERRR